MHQKIQGIHSLTCYHRRGKAAKARRKKSGKLTLLTGSEGMAWWNAANTVARAYDLPLVAYRIGPEGELQEIDSRWTEIYGVGEDGAVLVRPDGFVAWRKRQMAPDPHNELRDVVERILGATVAVAR